MPIDCEIGNSCYIPNYVDADPSHTATVFTCGKLTYDSHIGTESALPTGLKLQDIVSVLASASGIVTATRYGMKDHLQRTASPPDVAKVQIIRDGETVDTQTAQVTIMP
jgi:hypothetical protein